MANKDLIEVSAGKQDNDIRRRLGHLRNVNDCPLGYAGDDCSIKASDCSAERFDLVHSCYYGSSCIDASNAFGLLDRYCECETAGELTAGLMCQYQATSICTVDEAKDLVTDQFCVNGGVCVAFVGAEESHPGCICEEGKWEGKHCEFAHGVLMDDALDLFQQRKTEIAIERSVKHGTLSLADTQSDAAEKEGAPLFFVVGAFIAVSAVLTLSIFAIWAKRKRQKQSSVREYHCIVDSKASISTHKSEPRTKSSQPPPADVFLESRKKELELHDDASFVISDSHEEDTDDVEMLDDETSRMIEAQFESSGSDDEEDHENEVSSDELVFAQSYENDHENLNQDDGLLHSRITVNSGKDPLSKLQNETLSDAVADSSVDDKDGMDNGTNGATSLDGEYDDDSDDDNYFV